MKKLFLCFVLFVVEPAHRHCHNHSVNAENLIINVDGTVAYSSEFARECDNIIQESKCGEPKEVLEYLEKNGTHVLISPSAVWVNRCIGLCESDNDGSCIPTETAIKHIPIRIYNLKTDTEACAMYPILEHVSCGCASHSLSLKHT